MDFYNITQEMAYIKKRNKVIKEIEYMVEQADYTKVTVDLFESYDDFVSQNKRIDPKTMVKLINPKGTVSILRPDITTNIIKQVANKWVEGSKIKLYYDSFVFRQTDNALIETHQFGLEQLGYNDLSAEKDVLCLIMSLLDSYDLQYKIRLGHQAFINDLFDQLALDDKQANQLKNELQAKNQAGVDAIIKSNNFNKDTTSILQNILHLEGTIKDIIQATKSMPLSDTMNQALEELKTVIQGQNNKDYIWIDLSLITNYDYYNGLLLEGYIKNVPRPIIQGGRYDKLTKQYKKDISAFGISLDYQALFQEVIPND